MRRRLAAPVAPPLGEDLRLELRKGDGSFVNGITQDSLEAHLEATDAEGAQYYWIARAGVDPLPSFGTGPAPMRCKRPCTVGVRLTNSYTEYRSTGP